MEFEDRGPGDAGCLGTAATVVFSGRFVAAAWRRAMPLTDSDEIEIVAPRQGG